MSDVSGLVHRSVDRPFADVITATEAAIVAAGAVVMARVDHAAAAASAGLQLRPTTVLMFGNPAGGTHLMQARPESAIDLPMKLLIVARDDGRVGIVAIDPAWIVERHGGHAREPIGAGMNVLMQRVLDTVTR